MARCGRFILLGIDGMMTYLTKRMEEEGVIRNISRLIRRGFARHAWPSPPMDTPTNWTTLATGAYTGTHGATSFYVHLPGERFEISQRARHRTERADLAQAEFIWQVADEAGLRPVVLNYPGGWGTPMREGAQIAGWWATPGVPPIRLAGRQQFRASREPAEVAVRGLRGDAPVLKLTIAATDTGVSIAPADQGKSGRKARRAVARYGQETWVELPPVPASEGHPLLALVRARKRGKGATLELQGVFTAGGWCRPDELAPKLLRAVAGFVRHTLPPKTARMGYELFGDEGGFLDGARHQARLFIDIMKHCMENRGARLIYSHFHLLDGVNHRYLAMLFPDHPKYTEPGAKHAWEIYREAYRVVDQYVGWAMRELADDETTVCVVSDHAALPMVKYLRVTRALIDAGLLAYKWNADEGVFEVDWDRTAAFPFSEPAYVWVNLKGREPTGIVEPEDYEDVRDAIIDALWSITDPDTGAPVMRAVLRREAAAPICGIGERIGDVLYFPRAGYGLYDGELEHLYHDRLSPEEMAAPAVRPAKQVFGYHAGFWPTEELGPFQDAAVLIMGGAGVAKRGWIDKPARLVDVAPTAAALLGIRPPRQAEGRVLHECIEG